MSTSLYDADYEALRALLKILRVNAKLTQVQLASAMRVGQSYVSKIERGESFVDVLLFAKWCEACGISPGVALDGLRGQKKPDRVR